MKTERAIKNRQSIDTGNVYTRHISKTNRINKTFEKVMSYTDVEKVMSYTDVETVMSYTDVEKVMSYTDVENVMSYTDVDSGADKGNKFLLEDVAGVCLKKSGVHNFFELRHLVLKR